MAIPIYISKIKLRRGSDSQRSLITPEEGEVIYTIDTKRVFVGDGYTAGGNVIGTKYHVPVTSFPPSNGITGDVVTYNNATWQLTGTDTTNSAHWGRIDTKFTSGLTADNVNRLKIDYETNQFTISGNQLSLKESGVPSTKLETVFAGEQSVALPFPILTVTGNGIVSTISYNLSGYTSGDPASKFFVCSPSALSAIAVDFSALVSGLTGYIRIYSTP